MLLLTCVERLMFKRHTLAATAGKDRWGRRRSSAIRTLVAETLVLAKTHGYVEKIEDELERELQRDFSDPPQDKIRRWRRLGDKIFKSKHMLLTVVILCIVDCALVLGELALDLYKVKVTLEDSSNFTRTTEAFLLGLEETHSAVQNKTPSQIFNMILESPIYWRSYGNAINVTSTTSNNQSQAGLVPCFSPETHANADAVLGGPNAHSKNNTNSFSGIKTNVTPTVIGDLEGTFAHESMEVKIIGDIAHIFHYCSIAILALILIETFLKAVCAGRSFFHRKIEVFDAFVVVVSFLMDFCFLVILSDIDTKDFVFILAILLPWRVIRVVNSLIVSVKDHEHFRLKLVYKRKKKIQNNLRDTETLLQKYMSQVTALQRLCLAEGVDEWKLDQFIKNEAISFPPTPQKKRFKFKFDDALTALHGSRGPRCSLPTLDFRGLKVASTSGTSKSRLSLPGVANTIKQHLTKRRSSLATMSVLNAKHSNGEVPLRRKKLTSEDLGVMHEHEDENDNCDSALSSRAPSESSDVFSRLSISESMDDSDQTTSVARADVNDSENTDDERLKLAQIQQDAKRRNSESTLDKTRLNYAHFSDYISYRSPCGKTFTRPHRPRSSTLSIRTGSESSNMGTDCDSPVISTHRTHGGRDSPVDSLQRTDSGITYIDEDTCDKDKNTESNDESGESQITKIDAVVTENNNSVQHGSSDNNRQIAHCNGVSPPNKQGNSKYSNLDVPIVIIHTDT